MPKKRTKDLYHVSVKKSATKEIVDTHSIEAYDKLKAARIGLLYTADRLNSKTSLLESEAVLWDSSVHGSVATTEVAAQAPEPTQSKPASNKTEDKHVAKVLEHNKNAPNGSVPFVCVVESNVVVDIYPCDTKDEAEDRFTYAAITEGKSEDEVAAAVKEGFIRTQYGSISITWKTTQLAL